ncbi:MAG: hypothetical protein J6R47_00880, partial [Acholeplasmatales bacterium]|nr:hypothetical protein [Acholeplasmatales bacterium]
DGSYIAPSDSVLLYDAANPFKDLAIEGTPRDNNGNSCLMTNCTLTFKVKKGSTVTINGYPGYTKYIINGRQVTETTYTTYFAEATEVTIVDNGGGYIKNIVVNPDGVGEVATISQLVAVGISNDPKTVGEELDLSSLQLKVIYSDKSFVVLSEGFTTDAETVVNKDAAGTYTVTVVYGDLDCTFNVVYKDASAFDDGFHRESKTWSFRTDTTTGNEFTTSYQGNAGAEAGLYIDATTGKLAPRGQQWAQFNQGTKISLVIGAGSTLVINAYDANYSVNGVAVEAATTTINVTVTSVYVIEATANSYIDSISVTFA